MPSPDDRRKGANRQRRGSMTVTGADAHTKAVFDLIADVRRPGARSVIGIAGPSGSGKSTLAARVVERLNAARPDREAATLLPMDGFHLETTSWMHAVCAR